MTELESAARRLATTLELADAGLEMMRCRFRREHPGATTDEIRLMMREWLHRRSPERTGRPADRRSES